MKFLKKFTAVVTAVAMLAIGNIGILPRDSVRGFMLSVSAEDTNEANEDFSDFDMDVYIASLMSYEKTVSGCDSTIYKNLDFYVNDEKTPTKIVYDELCNDTGFKASFISWEAMKFAFEPSSISETFDKTDYYEMILLSILGNYIEGDEVFDELNLYNAGIKTAVDEIKILSVVTDDNFQCWSEGEQKILLSNFGEIFEKQFGVKGSFPDIHDSMMQGAEYSLKLGKTLEESMRMAVAFWYCANLSKETKAVVEDMYAIAVKENADSNLIAALKNIMQSFDDTGALWESIFNAEEAVLKDLFSIGLDALWEDVCTKILPSWFILKVGYGVGTFISNSLFSTDEIIEQFFKMKCLVDCEGLIRKTVAKEIEDFKSEQTNTNANVLFASVDIMYDAYDLSCDYAIDYADIVFNAPASEVYDTLQFIFTGNVNRYDNFVESVNTLRKYTEDSRKIPDTHYKGDLILDYPEVYDALIEQEEQERYEASIVHVTGVKFMDDEIEIGLEDDYVMFYGAIVSPSHATMKELMYSSSNPSVAEYLYGNIRYYQEGTTTITAATVDGGYTASIVVNVVEGHGKDGGYFGNEIIDSGTCGTDGDSLTWTLDSEGTLTISGEGKMMDWDSENTSPWYDNSEIKNVVIENGVSNIGNHAFDQCLNINSIEIPDSITSIGDSAFNDCWCLNSIIIPNSVISIGDWAFEKCSALTSIIIPDSVTSIGGDAFIGTPWLESQRENNPFVIINGILVDGATCKGDIIIPNHVTTIGSYAFFHNETLTSVEIPITVNSVEKGAFSNCEYLTNIYYEGNREEWDELIIGYYNIGLDNVKVHFYSDSKEIEIIDSGNCGYEGDNLTWYIDNNFTLYIVGEGKMKELQGSLIFTYWGENSKFITDVIIKNGCTNITAFAFYDCDSLTSVRIPASVSTISKNAFTDCSSLSSLNVDEDNNSYRSINGVLFDKEFNSLMRYPAGKKEDLYIIPNGVTNIGDSAFKGCNSLVSIEIPDGVTSIGVATFRECNSLASITVPNSIKNIGDFAFYNNYALNDVYYTGTKAQWDEIVIGSYNHPIVDISGAKIHYNSTIQTVSTTTTTTTTSTTTSTTETSTAMSTNPTNTTTLTTSTTTTNPDITPEIVASGECGADGDNLTWTLDSEGTLTISGEGAMEDSVTSSSVPWNSYSGNIVDVIIEDDVTSIGDYAFFGCDYLTSITIPDSVTSIGDSAFSCCDSLTSIIIPDSVTSIGNDAFFYCYSLTSITIPDSVTSIGDSAFYLCDSLTSITIPDSVTSIGDSAFSDCYSLTSITIPDSVTSIGDSAFSSCDSLTSIIIPDSVTSIGNDAFYRCDNLTSITIPDSVTSIGDSAFFYCDSLTSITIPDSVTSIGDYAFVDCNSLTSVTIPASVTSIGDYAFDDCDSLTSITIENSECEFGDIWSNFPQATTIYGYTGSTAHTYAEMYGNEFVSLGEEPLITIPTTTSTTTTSTTTSTTTTTTTSTTTTSTTTSMTTSTTTTSTTTNTTTSTTSTSITTSTTISTTTTSTTTSTTTTATSTTTTQSTTTSTTTTSTTSTPPTTTSTTTSTTHIVSDEELCDWAVKDYEQKTGVTPENAEIEYTADGTAMITLIDAEGNVLGIYTVDPFTGVGTATDGGEVNLPQTGFSVVYNYIMLTAGAMVLFGIFAMVKSRRRDEE